MNDRLAAYCLITLPSQNAPLLPVGLEYSGHMCAFGSRALLLQSN
jgi:hypothetical protein